MTKQYAPYIFLKIEDYQVYAVCGWSRSSPQLIPSQSWLAILQIFTYCHDLESAYAIFNQIRLSPISEETAQKIGQYQHLICNQALVLLREKDLTILEKDFNSFFDKQQFSLNNFGENNPQLLIHLFSSCYLKNDLVEINQTAFNNTVLHLEKIGLLSPTVNSIDWGDLKRIAPFCQTFGFLRGKPIDRYYLDKFINEIKQEICGDILEIGATENARESYDLNSDSSYRVMNVCVWKGVDIVGDAHDTNNVEAESFDTILLFNVLEHCYAPWLVLENIHKWLKPGGKCFVSVPSAVRIHHIPQDYWRPLPDAFNWMLRNFSQWQVFTYGNAMTVVASYYGVSAEELTTEELDSYHSDYPVITCVSAKK